MFLSISDYADNTMISTEPGSYINPIYSLIATSSRIPVDPMRLSNSGSSKGTLHNFCSIWNLSGIDQVYPQN